MRVVSASEDDGGRFSRLIVAIVANPNESRELNGWSTQFSQFQQMTIFANIDNI